ncbi:DUF4082 domain-containing protein [Thalassomonas viridans]|uniref:DUF4082 domain-containing protein n=1 Tax=Thalassomonas viridans TaxID=137584 RepID=A0AAE9Z072_9GAMM|nr:PEP-CTERM sorting domain-containing protein [Thalassomonas viridans]WDE03634.1 DUF4082 domain-containing protein [Thalassomonas viridans]
MKKLIKLLCVTLLLPFFAGNQALASTMALGFPDEPTDSWIWPGATIGWEFTTSTDIQVDSLGVWDEFGDGLAEEHAVGIWTLDGTLLTSAIVGSGTSADLDSSFRWVDIPSFALDAGSYVVGAYFSDNSDRGAARSSYTTASEITFNQNLFLYNNGFTLPTSHWSGFDGGNFGANFKFTAASVPEPSALFLFGLGFIGMALRKAKK